MSRELDALRAAHDAKDKRGGSPRLKCPCGRETEVQMQVALRERHGQHKSLGSKSISLCVRCAVSRQAAAVLR